MFNGLNVIFEIPGYVTVFALSIQTPELFRCQICGLLFYFNKLSFGKTFICKIERLNTKQLRSR